MSMEFGITCKAKECTRPGSLLGGRCNLHEALAQARELSPEQFDELREALSTTPPFSEADKRARRVKSTLARVQWTARDLKRAKLAAREAGATDSQVRDAVGRGRAGVR